MPVFQGMLVQEKVRWCQSLTSSNKVLTTSSNKVHTQYILVMVPEMKCELELYAYVLV